MVHTKPHPLGNHEGMLPQKSFENLHALRLLQMAPRFPKMLKIGYTNNLLGIKNNTNLKNSGGGGGGGEIPVPPPLPTLYETHMVSTVKIKTILYTYNAILI